MKKYYKKKKEITISQKEVSLIMLILLSTQ